MKNIEKYQNTKDALEAWNKYRDGKGIYTYLDDWLELEYAEPREPTLLEAANAAVKAWYTRETDSNLKETRQKMEVLSEVVYTANQKPVRNCDAYKTAEEASKAFDKFCDSACHRCVFRGEDHGCFASWLYAALEKAGGAE